MIYRKTILVHTYRNTNNNDNDNNDNDNGGRPPLLRGNWSKGLLGYI